MYLQVRSRSRSSSVSLTVETALGSFDFLNTSDLEEEEEEDGEKQSVTDRSELKKCLTFLMSRGILKLKKRERNQVQLRFFIKINCLYNATWHHHRQYINRHYCHPVPWKTTVGLSELLHKCICVQCSLFTLCLKMFLPFFFSCLTYVCSCVCFDWYSAEERPAAVESAGEDEGCEARCWDTPSGPLSTGCPALDHTLLVHLKNCSSQLLVSYCTSYGHLDTHIWE